MKTTIKIFALLMLLGTLITACKKDDDDVKNPSNGQDLELITTLKMVFKDSADHTNIKEFVFKDADGEGGNAPSRFDTIKVNANKTYLVDIILLDESNPMDVDTISNEVAEEANDHQFFFHAHDVTINYTYLDADTNVPPLPIGLNTKWRMGNTGFGETHVVLKHQPGTKDGKETTGETDIEVEFPILIQ